MGYVYSNHNICEVGGNEFLGRHYEINFKGIVRDELNKKNVYFMINSKNNIIEICK